jgi:hypothetical protein
VKLPDPIARRHELEKNLDPAKCVALAEAYVGEGRGIEAVAFLVKADARDRLRELADAAVADGDAFLLREVATALEEEPAADAWQALAAAAETAGKTLYAEEARRQVERLERLHAAERRAT